MGHKKMLVLKRKPNFVHTPLYKPRCIAPISPITSWTTIFPPAALLPSKPYEETGKMMNDRRHILNFLYVSHRILVYLPNSMSPSWVWITSVLLFSDNCRTCSWATWGHRTQDHSIINLPLGAMTIFDWSQGVKHQVKFLFNFMCWWLYCKLLF